MPARRSKTKVLVDGADPQETARVKALVGFVDGQTTNPTLISKNPEVRQLISSGHKFSAKEELDEYKTIVQIISPLVGDAGRYANRVGLKRPDKMRLILFPYGQEKHLRRNDDRK